MSANNKSNAWRRIFLVLPGVPLMSLLRGAVRRPKMVLAVFALGLALFSPGLAKLQILLSVVDTVDARSETRQLNQLTKRAFPGDQEFTILFETRDQQAFTEKELCRIRSWTRRQNFTNQELQFVNSPLEARVARETVKTLLYPLLVTLDCEGGGSDQRQALKPLLDSPLSGIFANATQSAILIDLYLRDTVGGSKYGAFDPAPVTEMKASLDQDFPADGSVRTTLGGSAAFKWYFVKSLMQDQSVNLMVLLVFCVGFCLLFGSWRGALLLALTLLLSSILLFAAMGFFGVPIDILTNSLFTIVALASTEDFIYLSQAQQNQRPGAGWREPFRQLIMPSFYTSLSTVVGFGSLCVSDIASIQRLGFWAAVGAALEFAMVFFVLPAFLQICPKFRRWTAPKPTRCTGFFTFVSKIRLPRPIFRTLLAAFALSIFGMMNLNVQDSLERMWDKAHPFNQGMQALQRQFGWNGVVDLVMRQPQDIPGQLKIISEVAKIPGVVKVENPYELLEFAGRTLSPERRALQQREFALSPQAERWISSKEQLTRATIFITSSDLATLRPIRQRINEICKGERCFITGDLATYGDFSDHVIATLIESFILSLGLVSFLMYGLARALNVRAIRPLIIASMWGPTVLLGATPLLFDGLNFVTCIFAAVLVGLAGDSGIQFLFASRHGDIKIGMASKGVGSLQMTALAAAGSLAYLGSDFAQPRILGLLFAAGFVCLLIGDLWLLKGLIAERRGRFFWSRNLILPAADVSGPDCRAVQWPKRIAEELKDAEDSECRAL